MKFAPVFLMLRKHLGLLFNDTFLTLTICQRYYGWDRAGCMLRNAEATLLSGEVSILDPSDGLWFPDWGKTDTCISEFTIECCTILVGAR